MRCQKVRGGRRNRASADGALRMGKHETGRDLHEEGQSREARKRGGAAPPWRTHRKRKCPTFPSGGAQWDEREKKFLKINAEKEGWCPGAELNHRHTDFQSVKTCLKAAEMLIRVLESVVIGPYSVSLRVAAAQFAAAKTDAS